MIATLLESGVRPLDATEYPQLVRRSAMAAPRRLKRDRPGQRPWHDYPRIRARVQLVERLSFRGYSLHATMRFVNEQLVANGQRPVSERTIDADRARMRELWAERPAGVPLFYEPRAVYQPRTTKPMDAYSPPPSLAPAEPTPAPPGPRIQRIEDLLAQDAELGAEEPEPW